MSLLEVKSSWIFISRWDRRTVIDFRFTHSLFDNFACNSSLPPSEKACLLKLYEDCERCVEQAFWIKMLNFNLMINRYRQESKQFKQLYTLLDNKEFIHCAKTWAAAFLGVKNSILKMNVHYFTLKCLVEKFLQNELKDLPYQDFLIALIIASDDPRIFTVFSFLDQDSLGWHIDEPPSGQQRIHNLKNLNMAIATILQPVKS